MIPPQLHLALDAPHRPDGDHDPRPEWILQLPDVALHGFQAFRDRRRRLEGRHTWYRNLGTEKRLGSLEAAQFPAHLPVSLQGSRILGKGQLLGTSFSGSPTFWRLLAAPPPNSSLPAQGSMSNLELMLTFQFYVSSIILEKHRLIHRLF